MVAAAKKIGAHEFIESLPGGYDYNVKERGVMLSAGQRQLIAFLRAYISKPNILVLDEATSSLDGETEAHVSQAIHKLKGEVTVILIAHRLSTIVHAEQILVMSAGEIVERGTHEQLIALQGQYAQMWSMQQQESEPLLAEVTPTGA